MKFQKTAGYHKWIVLVIDLLIIWCSIAAIVFVMSFRLSTQDEWVLLGMYGLPAFVFAVLTHFLFRPHLVIIRNLTLTDVARLSLSRFVYFGFILLFTLIYNKYFQDIYILVVFVLDAILSFSLLLTFRIWMRWLWGVLANPSSTPLPTAVIYGAGELGKLAYHSLGKHFDFVGFIDDDPDKQGKYLFGKRIIAFDKAMSFTAKKNVEFILTAIPSLPETKRKDLVALALRQNIQIQNIPHSTENYNGSLNINQLRDIHIEDLLNRKPISINNENISDLLFGKTILITGAAGSIGSEIARQVMGFWPSKIILFDQAETPMFHLERDLGGLEAYKNIEKQFVIGDIVNEYDLLRLFRNEKIHIVYHAAAYKHVPLMEKNPMQALTINAIGSSVLAELSLKFEVERFVQVSTDKAVNPTNIMGASKRAAELYIQSLQIFNKTKFITTRFGNVLGSNGSVVPFFKEQIAKGGPITVTHPDVERYFMTIPEACSLVLEAGTMSSGGEIFVFDMGEPVKIKDLAERMIRLSGLEPNRDIAISYIGLRPGEKLFEELLSNSENTLPTYHDQILIAQVSKKEYKDLVIAWERLRQVINTGTQEEATDWLQRMVPEFETQDEHLTRVMNLEEKPVVPKEVAVSPYLLSRKKRFFDLLLSLIALPFVLVLLVLTALIHPFFAGFPLFFYHLRMGKGSKAFNLFKLRTLKLNHNNIRAGMGNVDGTVIPIIGKVLRTYRIDELPQVWNIIKGDMSWVGPRPEQIKVAEAFMTQHPEYEARHSVLPGITGLAQLSDPNAVLDDFEEKLYHDLKYIRTASLYLDLYILFKSISVVAGSRR